MFAVADYEEKQVIDAMAYYIKHWNEFPSASDIVQIIVRGNKPPFKESVFIAMQKIHPEDRTSAEWAYIKDYNNWNLRG